MINHALSADPPALESPKKDQLCHNNQNSISLGCWRCPELGVCGGLAIKAPAFSCMAFCCNMPSTCTKFACPLQDRYSALVNEVSGFELTPYVGRVRSMSGLPEYVPCVLDRGGLAGPLPLRAVAISLYSIIDMKSGLSRFQTKEELLAHFRIESRSELILTASGHDRQVEGFWSAFKPKKTASSIARLQPSIISTPNFSMHVNAVRHDNLLSMARIRDCFASFAAAGLPVALHPNGRTDHDFKRWAIYIANSPGIHSITYEFATIGNSRSGWHVDRLKELGKAANRPITLLLRGGFKHLQALSSSFTRIICVDTTPLMKAKNRQVGSYAGQLVSWTSSPTSAGEPIDEIFLHNIRAQSAALHDARSLCRPKHSGVGTIRGNLQ